jgi:type VI secretion system VgrG family protein
MIKLSLAINGVDEQQLTPFSVDGTEELSTLFVFDVLCLSSTTLPLKPNALGRSATLTISSEGAAPRTVQGIVESFSILPMSAQEQVVYRIRIMPALAQLRLSRHNRIYGTIEQIDVADILQAMLQGTLQRGSQADNPNAPNLQYDLRLRHAYPKFHHVTQYEETDFDFLSRLTEHWGICFFFENQDGGERVVFADDPVFAPLLSNPSQLRVPPWSASGPAQPNMVQRFEARHQQVPHRIFLQDYNERLPQVPLLVSTEIDPQGSGYVVEYGDHYRTPSEGEFLARIRSQELHCMKSRFSGSSTAAALVPGYCFDLADCDVADWNERYLVISVRHRARVSLHGLSGIAALGSLDADSLLDASAAGAYGYSNDFTAMVLSEDAPFRPVRRTPAPRIHGLLNGRIETSLDDNRPQLNEDGWYRVRLPFDLGSMPGGQASRWIRMAEPYGGPSNGMHFPLPPDTDVVIACVNGDPDRPVIVGAVPSANAPSVVTGNTSHLNRIQTRSGIVFTMADFNK